MGTSGEVAPARNLVSVARDNGSTVYDVRVKVAYACFFSYFANVTG